MSESAAMPETQEPQQDPPQNEEIVSEKKFTQADLDRIIASRVAPLQQKASEYDKLVESQKSESQKQAETLARLQAENDAFKAGQARREAAKTAQLPVEAYDLVAGSTEAEIQASVETVKALIMTLQGPRTPQPDPAQGGTGHTPISGDFLRDAFNRRA